MDTVALVLSALGLVPAGVGLVRWVRSRQTGWVFIHRDGVPVAGALVLVAGQRFTTNEVGEAEVPLSLEGRQASVRNPARAYRQERSVVLKFEGGVMSVSI